MIIWIFTENHIILYKHTGNATFCITLVFHSFINVETPFLKVFHSLCLVSLSVTSDLVSPPLTDVYLSGNRAKLKLTLKLTLSLNPATRAKGKRRTNDPPGFICSTPNSVFEPARCGKSYTSMLNIVHVPLLFHHLMFLWPCPLAPQTQTPV